MKVSAREARRFFGGLGCLSEGGALENHGSDSYSLTRFLWRMLPPRFRLLFSNEISGWERQPGQHSAPKRITPPPCLNEISAARAIQFWSRWGGVIISNSSDVRCAMNPLKMSGNPWFKISPRLQTWGMQIWGMQNGRRSGTMTCATL